MSLISIIVPVFNSEKYLSECIDSILSQTLTDFELILVNDGSTDNSPKICDNYAKKDSRVNVIHKENGGASSARNVALDWIFANSNSKYIGFVDSDDLVHPQMYEYLLKAIKETESQIALCDYVQFEKLDNELCQKKEYTIIPEKEKNDGMFLYWTRLSDWDRLFVREVWGNLRFPVGKISEDRAMFVPLHFNRKIVRVCADLYYYRIVGTSVSRKMRPGGMLNNLWAMQERVRHLNEIELEGKEKLIEIEVKKFCKYSEIYYYRMINEYGAKDDAFAVKENLIKTFNQYKKVFDFPKEEFLDCYLLLYPISTKIYCYKKAILDKIKSFF